MNSNENNENDEKPIILNRTAIRDYTIKNLDRLVFMYPKHATDCNCGFRYCRTGGREPLNDNKKK
jgi:hypothetical protein